MPFKIFNTDRQIPQLALTIVPLRGGRGASAAVRHPRDLEIGQR